jgi:hypothetical protein
LGLVLFGQSIFGQRVQTILQGNHSDSSFYHVKRVGVNEFWAGGEHGILKSIDTLGRVRSVNFPNKGLDILKIELVNNYIFLITANAIIYRYDMEKDTFMSREFPQFQGKCFYDLIGLPNGHILVCGGATGIAKGRKKIPRGFIAIMDKDLNHIDIVWSSFRKFVWSLLDLGPEGVVAATFNGLKTKIIETKDLQQWKKNAQVNGLVHELSLIDNNVWYSGTKSIHYKKSGIWGRSKDGKKPNVTEKTGCLWKVGMVNGKIISVTYNGEILKIDPITNNTNPLTIAKGFSLYGIEKISDSKILVVGNGKGAYIVDFEN